mmetsp:Transcript_13618/g.29444  ORF Transcript_13618/g.29444 Transcript_13618/m.29444 type:complete len:414 (+) Transcript_13618:190-1431(+)
MRQSQSSPTLSLSPPSPSSSERVLRYKNLNFISFASTLVYIGYLFGSMNSGGQIVTTAFSLSRGNGDNGDNGGGNYNGGRLRATSNDDAVAMSHRDLTTNNNAEKNKNNNMEGGSSKPSYARGPVIDNNKGKGTSISLIGERHSGTNWITDHLVDCFGDQIKVEPEFTRFKHWFQFDDATVRNDSAVIVAMFRDPYDWVEAMREHPHHAHGHIGVRQSDVGMEWKDFVTKPWVGPRGAADLAKMEKAKEDGVHIDKMGCLAGYRFDEVIPCSEEDSVLDEGFSTYMYELRNDESHRAFSSIVELRTAKILNFLQVPTFHGVKAFFPERYEALKLRGTADFLSQLEEVTGLKAQCEPLKGTEVVNHKDVDPAFTAWMNRFHDWETEEMIGYVRRDPVPRRRQILTAPISNAQVY